MILPPPLQTPKSPGFPIVGIGASAGGIKALKEFFAHVDKDSGMAYVVVVHLSEEHESVLAQILEASASIPATQVTGTVEVVSNHIYVIPPGQHLEMVDGCIHLAKPQRFIGQRVPIDRFFRTLAGAYGKEAFAIILSGAGSDGS